MKKSAKSKMEVSASEIPKAFMQKLQRAFQAPAGPGLSCPEPEQVVGCALEELEAAEHQKIQAHLLTCRDCLDLYLDVRLARAEAESPGAEGLAAPSLEESPADGWLATFGSKFWETLQVLLKPGKLIPAVAAVSLVVLVVILGREATPPGLAPPHLAMERHPAPAAIPGAPPPQELADAKPSQALPGLERRAFKQKSEKEVPPSQIQTAVRGSLPEPESIRLELAEAPALAGGARLSYKVDRDAFAYLLWHDGSGKIGLLFSGNLEGGKTYFYPERDPGLKPDSDTGQATVYLIASEKPVVDLDKKIPELEHEGVQRIQSLFPGSTIRSLTIKLP